MEAIDRENLRRQLAKDVRMAKARGLKVQKIAQGVSGMNGEHLGVIRRRAQKRRKLLDGV